MTSGEAQAPLGFHAARRVIELGRSAFFEARRLDAPKAETPQIAADDQLPQFGFVGPRFSERRVLFLGINPGNGPRSVRNAGDERTMPTLEAFAANPTPETFQRTQNAYREVCEQWRMWGHECSELLQAVGLSIDEVGFTNVLPWRTASTSQFHKSVSRKTASLYVGPYLEELQPRLIVAVGKKANEALEFLSRPMAEVVVWNRARAPTAQVVAEREAASMRLVELLQQAKHGAAA